MAQEDALTGGIEEVQRSARKRATGCRKRSIEHAYSFRRWDRRARLFAAVASAVAGLGGLGAIASAEAGTLLAVIGGSLAAVGVIARASDEALGTSKTAEDHRKAASQFRGLQLQYLTLGTLPESDLNSVKERFLQIQGEAIEIEAGAPMVEDEAREWRERNEEAKR